MRKALVIEVLALLECEADRAVAGLSLIELQHEGAVLERVAGSDVSVWWIRKWLIEEVILDLVRDCIHRTDDISFECRLCDEPDLFEGFADLCNLLVIPGLSMCIDARWTLYFLNPMGRIVTHYLTIVIVDDLKVILSFLDLVVLFLIPLQALDGGKRC